MPHPFHHPTSTTRRLLLVAFAATLLTSFVGCGAFLNSYNHDELAAENGLRHIRGTIVDNDGNPVTNVNISLRVVTWHYDRDAMTPSHTVTKQISSDGTFDLAFDPAAADIRMFFQKENYYDTDAYIFTIRPRTPQKDYYHGFAVDSKIGSRNDVRIVMDKYIGDTRSENQPKP